MLFSILDSLGNLASFSLSLFNFLKGLRVNIDVEIDSIFVSVKFAEFFSFRDVIDDETFTVFL